MVLVVFYPSGDGELHIQAQRKDNNTVDFAFTHTLVSHEWDTLVAAAGAIIAQEERSKYTKSGQR